MCGSVMAAVETEPGVKQIKTYDHLYKLVLVGDYDVGKQELIRRFVDGYFQGKYVTNVAVDLKVKTINLDGKKIKLQLWDTVGNERFRSLTGAYFRGAHGVLLVYDVGNSKSFDSLCGWHREVEQYASPDVSRLMVGNRCDQDIHEVSEVAGQHMAEELGYRFFEVSARTGQMVNEAFLAIVHDIQLRLGANNVKKKEENIILGEPKHVAYTRKDDGKCCI